MRRIFLLLTILVVAGACAKPRPMDQEIAIERVRILVEQAEATGEPLDVERAQEILRDIPVPARAPQAATAEPVERHDMIVRFQDPNRPPGQYRFQVQAETQLAEWAVGAGFGEYIVEDDAVDDVFMTLISVPVRWGCLDLSARFLEKTPQEDGTVRRSEYSNVIRKGECIEPAPEKIPIAVPEPEGGYHILAIVLCLITILWMKHAKGKDR